MAKHYNIGLISRSAIDRFIKRERGSWDHYLDYSEAKLDRLMERLPEQPPIWFVLTKQQKAMFLICAKLKRFAVYADTGTGKTLLSIALMRYFKRLDVSRCNIVLVPNLSNKWEWATEGFDKHAPSVVYQVLDGTTDEKWRQFTDTDAEVYIETYGGFMHMLCTLKEDTRKRKKKNNRMVPNKTRIEKLLKKVEGLIIDESTFAKSRDALPFRLAQRVAKRASIAFTLSATPFGRDPIDLWAQMFLVDQGYALGETLGLFRQTFYTSRKTFWGGLDWRFDKAKQGMLHEFLKDSSIVLDVDPKTLPRLIQLKRYCTLGVDAEGFYQRVKEQMRKVLGDHKAMESAFMRARQISSGFIGYEDELTGDRASYVFEQQPKLDLLERCLEEDWDDRFKFIVFHEFNFSGDQLAKLMEKMGVGYVLGNGKTKDRDVPLIKRKFKEDKRCKAFLLSNSWGSYGQNLQIAKYGFFYESPLSPIIRQQAQRRYERQYSPHSRVYSTDLIMDGTVDEAILGYHAEGKALWKSILGTGKREQEKLPFFGKGV